MLDSEFEVMVLIKSLISSQALRFLSSHEYETFYPPCLLNQEVDEDIEERTKLGLEYEERSNYDLILSNTGLINGHVQQISNLPTISNQLVDILAQLPNLKSVGMFVNYLQSGNSPNQDCMRIDFQPLASQLIIFKITFKLEWSFSAMTSSSIQNLVTKNNQFFTSYFVKSLSQLTNLRSLAFSHALFSGFLDFFFIMILGLIFFFFC